MTAVMMAPPALAVLNYTLPGGYRLLTLKADGPPDILARGAYVPLIWFGGPFRFGTMRFEGGGSYLTDGRGSLYTYANGQAILNLELPLGPFTPYAGAVAHAAYPFQQAPDVAGMPYGLMPQVGVGLDLGVIQVDLHAGTGPVWGLSQPNGGAYRGTLTDIGGRLSVTF